MTSGAIYSGVPQMVIASSLLIMVPLFDLIGLNECDPLLFWSPFEQLSPIIKVS